MKWINEPCVGARLRRIVCLNRISTLIFLYTFLLMTVNALFNELKLSCYIIEKSTVHYWIYIQLLFDYILCFNAFTTMSFDLFIQFVHLQLFTIYYIYLSGENSLDNIIAFVIWGSDLFCYCARYFKTTTLWMGVSVGRLEISVAIYTLKGWLFLRK